MYYVPFKCKSQKNNTNVVAWLRLCMSLAAFVIKDFHVWRPNNSRYQWEEDRIPSQQNPSATRCCKKKEDSKNWVDEENVCVFKVTVWLIVLGSAELIITETFKYTRYKWQHNNKHRPYMHRYAEGLLHAPTEHCKTALLVHESTQRTMDSLEQIGEDSVLEQEVDELLAWTNALNFDE